MHSKHKSFLVFQVSNLWFFPNLNLPTWDWFLFYYNQIIIRTYFSNIYLIALRLTFCGLAPFFTKSILCIKALTRKKWSQVQYCLLYAPHRCVMPDCTQNKSQISIFLTSLNNKYEPSPTNEYEKPNTAVKITGFLHKL